MKSRNPSVGRHGAGSAIARSGTMPPSRTGRPSGQGVGTGVNQKTGAAPSYKPGIAQKNDNGQMDQWLKQAPEPFRNSQPSANPRNYPTGPSAKVGGVGGKTGVAGAMTGSAGYGSSPQANMNAASAGVGKGQEKGHVIGKSQPRRTGNNRNQPVAKFYGR